MADRAAHSTRAGVIGVALGALIMSLAPQSASASDGLLFTGDWQSGRIRIQDLSSNRVVYDLTSRAGAVRDTCGGGQFSCFPMGFEYSNHDDRDFLTVSLVGTNYTAESFYNFFPSALGRFELTTPAREIFSVRTLDFRDLPNRAAHCDQSDAEPAGDPNKAGCSVQFSHGIRTIADIPEESIYSYVVADAFNGRILGVTLDYAEGSTIGHVDFALGTDTPGWPLGGLPNAAQYYREPDGNFVLATFYSNGEVEGASAGSLMMFKEQADGSWAKQWQFPEVDASETPFLHSVHMGQVLVDPTNGERTLFYAHGRALATDWGGNPNADLGGSAGVLNLGDSLGDAPTYLGEGVPYLSEVEGDYRPYRYARDVEFMNDGRLILTDASCENGCNEPGQHFIVEPFHRSLTPSDRSGSFSAGHGDQDLIDLNEIQVVEQLQCGHEGVFESHWESTAMVGRSLRRAARTAVKACESELAPERSTMSLPPLLP